MPGERLRWIARGRRWDDEERREKSAAETARLCPITPRLRERRSSEALYAKHGLDARGIAAAASAFVSDVRPSIRRSG